MSAWLQISLSPDFQLSLSDATVLTYPYYEIVRMNRTILVLYMYEPSRAFKLLFSWVI